MKNQILLSVAVVMAFAQASYGATYMIDPSHSHVGFTIRHLVGKVPGEFKEFSGEFQFDDKKPEISGGKFVVKSASVSTNQAKRDEHLRSEDFFSSDKFPTITFETTSVSGKAANLKLTGSLTLLGVKKPVVFDVEFLGLGKDPYGNEKAGFTARAKINRKDFGMVWNKALDAGGYILGDDVELVIQVEANAKK